LILEPVVDDHLALIIPSSHPLNHKSAVYLKEVVHEAFVGFNPSSALQAHINTQVSRMGYELNFRVRMNTFEGLCEMVANGIGLGIVPEITADKYQARFDYKKIELLDPWAKRKLCICYQRRETLSPGMQKLLSYLQQGA